MKQAIRISIFLTNSCTSVVIFVIFGLLTMIPLKSHAQTTVYGDFNGDGFSDLAIGVPYEDIGSNMV